MKEGESIKRLGSSTANEISKRRKTTLAEPNEAKEESNKLEDVEQSKIDTGSLNFFVYQLYQVGSLQIYV